MTKWLYVLLIVGVPFNTHAQKGTMSLKFNGNFGLPIMSQKVKEDHFLLGAINTSNGANLGMGFQISNRIQLSALFGIDVFSVNKSNFKEKIGKETLVNSNSLVRINPNRFAVDNNYLALELKYLFRFKKFQLEPFLMSRIITATSTLNNIDFYEKTQNDHNYKNTKWEPTIKVEDAVYFELNPSFFTLGIGISKNIFNNLYLLSAIQYTHTTLKLDMIKSESYFNQNSTKSQETFKQRYRGIAMQVGIELKFPSSKKPVSGRND